jgi:predicted short-subunit dehydrogenase-like oxidoreductase (DUF2520 family)
MRKQPLLGLVVEGNSTGSAVLRLPNITEELGPIKSAALRVARRLSNFLRAGYAVAEYQELQAARVILLRVPDAAVLRIVSELSEAELVFKELSFVLCESWLTSNVLEPLRRSGASVATLVGMPVRLRNWFALEGDPSAVRQVRRVIDQDGARTFELRPGTKPLYFAGQLLATTLPQPLIAAAQQALRSSGISGKHLSIVLEGMVHEMFSTFLKGARTPWGGPLAECSTETVNYHLEVLRRNHRDLAGLVDEQLASARRRMLGKKWRFKI